MKLFIILFTLCVSTCLMARIKKPFPNSDQRGLNIDTCDYGFVYNGTDCEECGLRNVAPNVRIVGGKAAVANSWPSQVLIIRNIRGIYKFRKSDGSTISRSISSRFMCGGSLINARTILTAGHCVSKTFPYTLDGRDIDVEIKFNDDYPTMESMLSVYLGAYDSNFINFARNVPLPAMKFNVEKVISHPSYNSNSLQNDIALFILSEHVRTTPSIKPACLPKDNIPDYPGFNKDVFAAGWGALEEGGYTPDVLNNVKLTSYSPSSCSRVLPSLRKNWDAQICAGELSGGKDTCQGDSGGGLYIRTSASGKERTEVVGIVSYGAGCARPGLPGIYTRTSYYLDWIKANWKVPEISSRRFN